MQEEGKPKKRTEKREFSAFSDAKPPANFMAFVFSVAIFTNWLAKKGEPVLGFG